MIKSIKAEPRSPTSQIRRQKHASQFSIAMSATTKKGEYAIQGVPRFIEHKKMAYADYFSLNDQVKADEKTLTTPARRRQRQFEWDEQDDTHVKADATNKHPLCLTLVKVFTQRHKSIIHRLKEHLEEWEVRKLPTFRPSSPTRLRMQQDSSLAASPSVGRISRQHSTSSPKKSLRQTPSNPAENVSIVNKMLLVEGIDLLQSYGKLYKRDDLFFGKSWLTSPRQYNEL